MAQLLLYGVQMVCGLPAAQIIGPVIATILPLSPLNWVIFASSFLYMKYSKATWKNRFVGSRSIKALLKAALVLYCPIAFILYFILIFAVCKAV